MANKIHWGQAATTNKIGFGQAASTNTIGFGKIHSDSWSEETNLVGYIVEVAEFIIRATEDGATVEAALCLNDAAKTFIQ